MMVCDAARLKELRGDLSYEDLSVEIYAATRVNINPIALEAWELKAQPPVDMWATLVLFYGQEHAPLDLLLDTDTARRTAARQKGA